MLRAANFRIVESVVAGCRSVSYIEVHAEWHEMRPHILGNIGPAEVSFVQCADYQEQHVPVARRVGKFGKHLPAAAAFVLVNRFGKIKRSNLPAPLPIHLLRDLR